MRHEGLYQSSLQHGRGVFARDQIGAGEPILTFSGPLLKRAEVREEDIIYRLLRTCILRVR